MEKRTFFVSLAYDCTEDWRQLLTVFGCIEEIERVFGIEFACAIEDDRALFLSEDPALLARFDGCVVPHVFREIVSGKLFDARQTVYRFDVAVDEAARFSGAPRFRNAKIVRARA